MNENSDAQSGFGGSVPPAPVGKNDWHPREIMPHERVISALQESKINQTGSCNCASPSCSTGPEFKAGDLYKCYFCKMFFCDNCSHQHFGASYPTKTVESNG